MSKKCGRTFRTRSQNKTQNAIDKNSADYEKLMKWMGEKGLRSCKNLRPKIFPNTGRGLMTTNKIKNRETFISIPENLLITPQLVLQKTLGKFFERFLPQAFGCQILSVFLMYEKFREADSSWHLYLKTLPHTYTTPHYINLRALLLLPTSLKREATYQIQALKESYEELGSLFDSLEKHYPLLKGKFSFELYRWAWCTVNTRSVYLECREGSCKGIQCTFHLALAPFLDLLNHSCHVQVKAGFNKKSKHYEIMSLCDFKKYSQVFINYGSHDNRTLFLHYGFVIPGNLNDSIPILEEDLVKMTKQCNGVKSSGLEAISFICEKNLLMDAVCTKEELSWKLLLILKILAVTQNPKLWELILHQDYQLDGAEKIKFNEMKHKLLLLKLEEYKDFSNISLLLQNEEIEHCHWTLISELCTMENKILRCLIT